MKLMACRLDTIEDACHYVVLVQQYVYESGDVGELGLRDCTFKAGGDEAVVLKDEVGEVVEGEITVRSNLEIEGGEHGVGKGD
ncbi:hypothetical protein Droror1_Dr00012334 [Drosera rotundifolia]